MKNSSFTRSERRNAKSNSKIELKVEYTLHIQSPQLGGKKQD